MSKILRLSAITGIAIVMFGFLRYWGQGWLFIFEILIIIGYILYLYHELVLSRAVRTSRFKVAEISILLLTGFQLVIWSNIVWELASSAIQTGSPFVSQRTLYDSGTFFKSLFATLFAISGVVTYRIQEKSTTSSSSIAMQKVLRGCFYVGLITIIGTFLILAASTITNSI